MDDIHLAYTHTVFFCINWLEVFNCPPTNTAALSELKHVCGSSKLSKVFVV